jgi:hypothetical protein
METMSLHYVADVEPARWIRDRLHPFAQDVDSLVPEGFDDHARVFHPANRDGHPVTWRGIAEATGRKVHAEMQFGNIAGAWRESPRRDLWTSPPATGRLPPDLARELVAVLRSQTTTPQRCWFAVWEGWGGLKPGTPRFDHPNRRYYLALGTVDDAASTVYVPQWVHQSASMWWPEDRAWFVATEVDLDSTYLAGTNACVDAVLAHPRIEALRARLSDGITIASDGLNPMPALARP